MPCRTSFRRNVHSRSQVSKTFGSCFPLSTDTHGPVLRTLASYQTCRRNSHKGAKTAEAERAHGWLTGAGDCIHLFWRSDLHQCRRAPIAQSGLFCETARDSRCVAEARQRRGERVLHQIHFNCSMTVPSEIVGRATPVLLAFLAIHSRAARVLSSAPALSS